VPFPSQQFLAADVLLLLMAVHERYEGRGLSWCGVHIQDHKTLLIILKFIVGGAVA
jgi:hypothetical protein